MKHILRVISHWGLLIHIYVSMAGFTLVLLFAITGLTLNHQDFGLGNPDIKTSSVPIPAELVDRPDEAGVSGFLTRTLNIRSPLTDYREDEAEIQLTYAAPGRRTLVTINRETRTAEVEAETRGLLGKLDDLHKGFDSGPVWYWMIDFAAILLTVSSLTGMVTLLALRARRQSGFVVGILGMVMVFLIYFLLVPQ